MITEREWHGLEVEAGVGYDALGPVATARQMTGGAMGQPPGTWGIRGGPTGSQRRNKRPDALREAIKWWHSDIRHFQAVEPSWLAAARTLLATPSEVTS